MWSAIPAQGRPARNALTVAANCVNRTRKHAASVTAYSVLRACPSIQRSTRSQPQRITANFRNEKELKLAEHWGITQNGLLVRLPFQFHFLHLSIGHRHCVGRLPRFAPVEVVFRMREVSRAENVGTE